MKKTSMIALLLALALTLSTSCNDPAKPDVDDGEGIEWPGMTSRDDVLEMLVLTYANPKDPESIPKYRALLHSQYFFELAPQDVPYGGSPIMARAEDIAATEWIFDNEKILELTLDPMTGTWYEYPDLEGQPCENCWATQPVYFIRAQFADEDKIYISPVGQSSVLIVVAPDENDSSKWVARAMYDIFQ